MQVTQTSGTQGQQSTTQRGMSGISGQDFMNLLIKQLQYQDPLEPMGNEEMMKQMSTIRELEMNTRLTQRLEQLSDQQRFGSAAALIGKQVKGAVTDEEGNLFELEGIVASVVFSSSGEVLLELEGGDVLPLSGVQQVTNPMIPAA
ncbi:MAG: hypothetical protein AMXMBFR13_47250 [Phycisphaerae bacterium]